MLWSSKNMNPLGIFLLGHDLPCHYMLLGLPGSKIFFPVTIMFFVHLFSRREREGEPREHWARLSSFVRIYLPVFLEKLKRFRLMLDLFTYSLAHKSIPFLFPFCEKVLLFFYRFGYIVAALDDKGLERKKKHFKAHLKTLSGIYFLIWRATVKLSLCSSRIHHMKLWAFVKILSCALVFAEASIRIPLAIWELCELKWNFRRTCNLKVNARYTFPIELFLPYFLNQWRNLWSVLNSKGLSVLTVSHLRQTKLLQGFHFQLSKLSSTKHITIYS